MNSRPKPRQRPPSDFYWMRRHAREKYHCVEDGAWISLCGMHGFEHPRFLEGRPKEGNPRSCGVCRQALRLRTKT